jgi:uncharacterized RDD family membrane protein YckC
MDEETIIDPPQEEATAPPEAWDHAGFWIRLVAHLIDSLIIIVGGVFAVFIMAFIGSALFGGSEQFLPKGGSPDSQLLSNLVFFAIALVYFSGMESSTYQGTLGKRALSLKVVNTSQQKISYSKALGRYFAEAFLSPILFIGYIMIAFDGCKRGLHDRLAGTYVIRNT